MRHTYNFSAGPSVLPEPVLQEAADEMMNYKGSRMSVMEISHRSALFQSIIDEAEYDLRTLMNISDDYEVLFLQGGTSLQFAMIPMNFMRNQKADYILTEHWSKKAYEETAMYGNAHIAASSEGDNFSYIPDCDNLDVLPDSDYVYMCENNTIYGTKFHERPNTKGKILIDDISSSFLSEPMDVSKYGMLLGGLEKMKEINEKKAAVLYDFLDGSKLFHGTVRKDSRSLMNVTFRTGSNEIDAAFVKEAEQSGIISIKGHRAVGGMRASIYNAMPMEGVGYLADFMGEFEKKYKECHV